MNIIRKIIDKYDRICIKIWLVYMIKSEDFRIEMEKLVYKMDSKIKDRK